MRIYADQELNVLIIEGVSQGPVADFKFSYDVSKVSAFRIGAQIFDLAGQDWTRISDGKGNYFSDILSLMGYLNQLTVPHFPLRFTTSYPITITGDDVELDQTFINQNIYLVDGGNA